MYISVLEISSLKGSLLTRRRASTNSSRTKRALPRDEESLTPEGRGKEPPHFRPRSTCAVCRVRRAVPSPPPLQTRAS